MDIARSVESVWFEAAMDVAKLEEEGDALSLEEAGSDPAIIVV